MRYLLSPACRPILARVASEHSLCAFDFDGTLSPIVEHPDRAGMSARTRGLLAAVARLYPCMIISGRARADVLGKLNGVRLDRVVGNHGAETGAATRKSRREVQGWAGFLELELKPIPGVWVEDKGLSLAVHYRQAVRKTDARRRILAAAEKLKHVRMFGGKQVVNLAVEQGPNKSHALAAERDRLGCDWTLYVGDDDNDEDAFALKGNTISVRVGRKARSLARYYLRRQAEIDDLLELLVLLRSKPGSSRRSTQ